MPLAPATVRRGRRWLGCDTRTVSEDVAVFDDLLGALRVTPQRPVHRLIVASSTTAVPTTEATSVRSETTRLGQLPRPAPLPNQHLPLERQALLVVNLVQAAGDSARVTTYELEALK